MVLNNFYKIKYKKRLRKMMRGYNDLKNNNKLHLIGLILSDFTTTNFGIKNKYFSKFIYGNAIESGEKILRQFLLSVLTDYKFNEELLVKIGQNKKVIYPLPVLWQKILINHGIKVNKFYSSILWQKFIITNLINGYINVVKVVFKFLLRKNLNTKNISSSLFFCDLNESIIPKNNFEIKGYNIINWFFQNNKKSINRFDSIEHNVYQIPKLEIDGMVVTYNSEMIPKCTSFSKLIIFSIWSTKTIFETIKNYFFGFWWNCILLNESILSKLVSIASKDEIANTYVFSNSSWIYRPLWTYEAEIKGSEIILYFYSTNCETFKTIEKDSQIYRGYASMSWPIYLVWDKFQFDFINSVTSYKSIIKIVGPIWFKDSTDNFILPKHKKSIAVFDVQPVRSSYYQKLTLFPEYYIPENCIQFLRDISFVLNKNQFHMVLKRKRNIGNLIHPQYEFYTKNLINNENITSINPDISAIRLIEKSFAVISMPFTSTAIIAKNLGKPSVFYDPFGIILKSDTGSHGIKIITGIIELNEWIMNIQD